MMDATQGDYTAEDHQRRFAVWAAGRATGQRTAGLTTTAAWELLAATPLFSVSRSLASMPETAEAFDTAHSRWCQTIIAHSGAKSWPTRNGQLVDMDLKHGQAAKLINVYLKSCFLSLFGQAQHKARLNTIHPPIDSILLASLKRTFGQRDKTWATLAKKGWKNFRASDYKNAIDGVREITRGQLWRIERYWDPFA